MKYRVTIYRTVVETLDFEVEADSEERAEEAAREQACVAEWDNGAIDYDVEEVKAIEDEQPAQA